MSPSLDIVSIKHPQNKRVKYAMREINNTEIWRPQRGMGSGVDDLPNASEGVEKLSCYYKTMFINIKSNPDVYILWFNYFFKEFIPRK